MPTKKLTNNASRTSKAKKIVKPVLKQKSVKFKSDESVNFEVPLMPSTEDFTKVPYEAQNEAYAAIKKMFVDLRENEAYMEEETFNAAYANLFYELLNLGVTGNVAAMDYLCYVYKKGIDGMLYPNLTLAHKWGMLAIANGSKLAIERMRMFLNPVFEYVDNSDLDLDKMIDRYEILPEEAVDFVAQTFAGIYNPKMGITLLSMAQEDPASVESNFTKFNIESCKKREEVLPELLKYLG